MSVINAASGVLPTAEELFERAWTEAAYCAGRWIEEVRLSEEGGDIGDLLALHYEGVLRGLALVLMDHPSYLGV